MPCGKRPLIKKWDKPRDIRVVTRSRYEQNEASVKAHWKKVIRDLELSYKDDKFWETQRDTVQELVGPIIFRRLAQMFKLPPDDKQYEPEDDDVSIQASQLFYVLGSQEQLTAEAKYSESDLLDYFEEEAAEVEEEESEWISSVETIDKDEQSKFKSVMKSKSSVINAFKSQTITKLNVSKMSQRSLRRSISKSKKFSHIFPSTDSPAHTSDDLIVQESSRHVTLNNYWQISASLREKRSGCILTIHTHYANMVKIDTELPNITFSLSS